MRPLSSNDIEAELSYAYLHAVAGHAGVGCRYACRHEDGRGIDAQLTAWGSWPDSYRTEVNLNVQLKATTDKLTDDGLHFSYFIKESKTSTHYDDLRSKTVDIPRILVVLCLPEDSSAWLAHSADQLVLKRCAYWVNLRGAGPTDNKSGVTVKFPKTQVFSPDGLKALIAQLPKTRRDEEP
ncbi:MAG TPA: DUF4365 domain-containing protein [Polyangium sp.]|nr:DUF4365 domain-containing protein [Polyangium sp.]